MQLDLIQLLVISPTADSYPLLQLLQLPVKAIIATWFPSPINMGKWWVALYSHCFCGFKTSNSFIARLASASASLFSASRRIPAPIHCYFGFLGTELDTWQIERAWNNCYWNFEMIHEKFSLHSHACIDVESAPFGMMTECLKKTSFDVCVISTSCIVAHLILRFSL